MARFPLALRCNSTAKVVAIKTSRRSLARTGNSQQRVWLDNMIIAVGIIRDSGELIPFPYVRIAAGIVFQVLLRVQAVRKNVDDFKGLSQKLVDAITAVRDIVCACGSQGQAPPPEFVHSCSEFVNKLVALQSEVNNLVRRHGSWTRFVRSTAITNTIAQYKEQVNDMRSNFTDFADFVKFRFRNRLGHQVIERGEFTLSLVEIDGTQQTLDQNPETWLSLIKPEVTITMDILVSGVNEAHVDRDSRRCPSCHFLCAGASLGDRAQWGIIEEVTEGESGHNPASGAPKLRGARPPVPDKNPREDLDESHFRYFRRFRVLLEEAITMTADVANNGAEESQDIGNAGSDNGSGIEPQMKFQKITDIEDGGSDDGTVTADVANNGAEESENIGNAGPDNGSSIESYVKFQKITDNKDAGSDDGSNSDDDLEYQHISSDSSEESESEYSGGYDFD
ncbi:hypothetical protein DXG01_012382 [Tephrocybe rancida]|nr:hypothetical protein DXG01_012382 [Tephrocybe rancida]